MKLRNGERTEERRVERETLLPAGPEEVWEALTDEDWLSEWFAPEVELEPYEGGEIAVRDGEDERTGTVETVIEEERLSFTWQRPGGEPSRVDLIVEAIPAGTRLIVVETAAGPRGLAAAGPLAAASWASRLARLARGLALAPVA
ncbi:MAG TPA: SRPBCC family protein [Solirubrobacterales bacterium]